MRIKKTYKIVNADFGYRIELRKSWLGFQYSEKLLKTKTPIVELDGTASFINTVIEFQTIQEAATLVHMLEAGVEKLQVTGNVVVAIDKELRVPVDLYEFTYRHMVRTHHSLKS